MKKLLPIFLVGFIACHKDDNTVNPVNNNSDYFLGWTGQDRPDTVPSALFGFGVNTIPSSYDITQYLPPVGDQGKYNTCVAWATGYNCKSSSEAIEFNRTPSQVIICLIKSVQKICSLR